MNEALRQSAASVIDSQKTAYVASAATVSTGIWSSLIPSTPAEVATCIGGFLSVVLIIKHSLACVGDYRERRQRMKKVALEIKNLKKEQG